MAVVEKLKVDSTISDTLSTQEQGVQDTNVPSKMSQNSEHNPGISCIFLPFDGFKLILS